MLSEDIRRLENAYSSWGGYEPPSQQLTFNELLRLRLDATKVINERLQQRTSGFRAEELLALSFGLEYLSSAELEHLRNKSHQSLSKEGRLGVLVKDLVGLPLYAFIVGPIDSAY